MNLRILTLLHIVRVPVEIVLYWLFISKAIPGLMTFNGRNFDILAGNDCTCNLLLWLCKKEIQQGSSYRMECFVYRAFT